MKLIKDILDDIFYVAFYLIFFVSFIAVYVQTIIIAVQLILYARCPKDEENKRTWYKDRAIKHLVKLGFALLTGFLSMLIAVLADM